MEQKDMLILTGPTAVGKTALSIQLAKRIGGEIISADSMQVYRHMDIGSAKIRPDEREGVPHHLIDVLSPKEPFHVVTFTTLARECLAGIYERGHIPIVAGGTGFYIQALLYDIDFGEEAETDIRQRLTELAAREGPHALHERLAKVDPDSAAVIHENNVRRMIRALEFYEIHQKPISSHNSTQRQKESPYRFCYFVLNDDRAKLYERIDRRVDQMIEEGLPDEVARLKEMGCEKQMTSMQGIGYKELLAWLEGEGTQEEAVAKIKQNSRHFAKRQLTWFKRERDVIWVNRQDFEKQPDPEEAILTFLLAEIRKKGILQ